MAVENIISQPELSTGYLYLVHWKESYEEGENPILLSDTEQMEYLGHQYMPADIKCSDIIEKTDGSANGVAVTVGNLDRAMQLIVEDNDLIERDVIQIQWFGTVANVRIFYWKIESVSTTEKIATFNLGTAVDFMRAEFPNRRMYSRFCSWNFKDEDCKYAGAETDCENTWEDCVARNNTLNFGGAPGLLTTHFFF